MKSKDFNVFKVEYFWYEGEHEEVFLGGYVAKEKFEDDLIKAKRFAEKLIGKKVKGYDYLGKGYNVECLPSYFEQIIWFLVNKLNYIECSQNEDICYNVNDGSSKKKIEITRSEEHIKNYIL